MKKILEIIKDSIFTFGILVIIFSLLVAAIGEKILVNAQADIFIFGNAALSVSIIFELLGLAVITNLLKAFFYSDFMIKKMGRTFRHIILFILIFIVLIAMIIIFDWFSSDLLLAWILTTIAFVVSFVTSTIITELKQKKENQELQDALNKMFPKD